MKVKSIKQAKNINGQTVFLRVDFNVPMKNGKVVDSTRMQQSLEDINYLMDRGCKIVIATHLGRPEGRRNMAYSVKPLIKLLVAALERPVKYIDATGAKNLNAAAKTISKLKPGSLVFLENLRFNKEEQKNDITYAKKLAALADVYVNNAFAVCHRADASVSAIKKYLPSYAGLLVEKEVLNLNKVLTPKKPMVAIVGGIKIETKLALLKKLSANSSKILLGSALAMNFFAAKGYNVGQNKVDAKSIKIAKSLLKTIGRKLILPSDLLTCSNLKNLALTKSSVISLKNIKEVKKDEMIVDVGPATIEAYAALIRKAKTIVWNGPLGIIEVPSFRYGTVIVARAIATRAGGPAFGVIGGGETIEAMAMTKMAENIDWISTGGGAMLSYLGGEKMPGLTGLISNK
ncbi:MAG: phosphoglycerate kinase [Candidatus Falkowbacteria bacterium]